MRKQARGVATRESIINAAGEVFAELHYETTRIADILDRLEITQGAFYFHFPEGKRSVALEVIRRQNARFVALREKIANSELDGIAAVLALVVGAGLLLENDPISRGGIRLVTSASSRFPEVARLPDPTWINAISGFLHIARGEGNLRSDVQIASAASSVVYLFTGAQVSSFVNDQWDQLPEAINATKNFLLRSLAREEYVPMEPKELVSLVQNLIDSIDQ